MEDFDDYRKPQNKAELKNYVQYLRKRIYKVDTGNRLIDKE